MKMLRRSVSERGSGLLYRRSTAGPWPTISLDRLDRKLALGLKTSLPEPESSSWNISDIVIIDLKVEKKDLL